jgi:cyclase
LPLAKRIIPCLDVDNGRVVKGVHFAGIKDAGDPVELAQRYKIQGADELVFLDITASEQGRDTLRRIVRNVARVTEIPFTVGGGIRKLEDARALLLSGADKVSINTAAIRHPDLIMDLMSIFGRQCVVVAIDAKRNYDIGTGAKSLFLNHGNKKFWFEVKIYGGKVSTGIDATEWVRKAESLGAGEILLTSIDADGTENGYDMTLTRHICEIVRIPVIASGGCGKPKDMLDVFRKTEVDAALAASIFHYQKSTIDKVKNFLKKNGIEIRV